jgi:intein/homing endonuclease
MIVACFDVNTAMTVLQDGQPVEKQVGDLRVGELVRTLSDDALREEWTEVVGVEETNGASVNTSFLFIELELEDGSKVTVTSDHGVLVHESASGSSPDSRPVVRVVSSQDIVSGDKLVRWESGEWKALKVRKVTMIKKSSKITVRTRSGTVLANGVLVSTLCGDAYESGSEWSETAERWKEMHFGKV